MVYLQQRRRKIGNRGNNDTITLREHIKNIKRPPSKKKYEKKIAFLAGHLYV